MSVVLYTILSSIADRWDGVKHVRQICSTLPLCILVLLALAGPARASEPRVLDAANVRIVRAGASIVAATVQPSTEPTYIQLDDGASSAVAQGGIVALTSRISSSNPLTNLHVSFEVHTASGAKVANPVIGLPTVPGGNTPIQVGTTWAVPENASAGNYVLKVFVFNADFSVLEAFDNGYQTFQVFPRGLAPVPPAAARATPIMLGATVDASSIDAFNAMAFPGRSGNVRIAKFFRAWETEGGFPQQQMSAISDQGALPFDEWGSCEQGQLNLSCTNAAVASGSYDTYLRTWALAAAAWGKPFFLSLDHEMNTDAYPWGLSSASPNTPASYVAMWRHVHDIFIAAGATNAIWVWAPNALPDGTAFDQFYPGDSYVDWVGMDGYNAGSSPSPNAAGGWHSMADEFRTTYADLIALAPDKPVLIGELASSEVGGSKAAWIDQGFSDLAVQFPKVGAVIWFEENKEQDWRIESSLSALSAFRSAVRLLS